VVYYFTSAVALGGPARKVSFAVPTGNFGDMLAGFVAKRMGLPIERLLIGTNSNDILARTLESGAYEMRGVSATTSPSMDIQISSNFERLLFEVHDRDGAAVRRLMQSLQQSGRFEIAGRAPGASAASSTQPRRRGEPPPRSAGPGARPAICSIRIPRRRRRGAAASSAIPATPMIVLGTAHPAKFPAAVRAASGVTPASGPSRRSDGAQGALHLLPNDLGAIEDFVRQNARAVRGAAA
jgi:threonine synthase